MINRFVGANYGEKFTNIQELGDFRMTIRELREHLDNLSKEFYGEDTILYTDAGANNVGIHVLEEKY